MEASESHESYGILNSARLTTMQGMSKQNRRMAKYVFWRTSDRQVINKIRAKFGIPKNMTVNWETKLPDSFNTNDPLLRETERRGFISIREK